MSDYNGWTNRETWNVTLWVMNDEAMYESWKTHLAGSLGVIVPWTVEEVADFLLEVFPEGRTPDRDNILLANLEEIAEAWTQSAIEHHPDYDVKTGKIAGGDA